MTWLLLVLATLPANVHLKDENVVFGAEHQVALHEDKLWWRTTNGAEWVLLPPDGLPHGRSKKFVVPTSLIHVTADGDNLVVLSGTGRVYYTKLSTLDWTDTWGPVGFEKPLIVADVTAPLAMSHRKIPYEDIDGNAHPISAGVTTLYALEREGRRLTYADPWLLPDFTHALCLPRRNAFRAVALSASASTVFVMDAAGRAYTRLIDFDSAGNNPALRYSWKREKRTADIRTLPAEDWREQPRINGWHSTRITVLQTGATNADRELRVEGQGGYWAKRVFDEAWQFVATKEPAVGAAVDRALPELSLEPRPTLHADSWKGADVSLEDFDPDCSPARVVLREGSHVLELPLHFHGRFLPDETKPKRLVRGALLLPEGDDAWVKKLRVRGMSRSEVEVELSVRDGEVVLRSGLLLKWRFRQKP